MRTVAILICLLVAAGFAAIAALPWRDEGAAKPAPQAALSASAPEAPTLPSAEEPTDLSAFAARPLFSAARRPPPPEAPGVPIADPGAGLLFGRYTVAGVVMLGDKALAMLRDRDGRLIRLKTGDLAPTDNGDAEIVEITLESLTFLHDGATVVAPVKREGAKTE